MSPREHKTTPNAMLIAPISRLMPAKNADGTIKKHQMQQQPRRKIGPPKSGISKALLISGMTSNMIAPLSHSLT
jgi:hypothetical protein